MRILVIPSDDDGQFRAAATNAQVKALGHYLQLNAVVVPVRSHIASAPFQRAANADIDVAMRWLSNSWNTERLLRWQTAMDSDAQRFAVQWAFPQAYYAAYCQIMALYSIIGKTGRLVSTDVVYEG